MSIFDWKIIHAFEEDPANSSVDFDRLCFPLESLPSCYVASMITL